METGGGSKCYNRGGSGWILILAVPPQPQDKTDRSRMTTCRDHVICMARGHVTSEPCKPTGVGARRACIASHVSHLVQELAELAL